MTDNGNKLLSHAEKVINDNDSSELKEYDFDN